MDQGPPLHNRDGDRHRYQDRWELWSALKPPLRCAARLRCPSPLLPRHGPVIFEEDDRLWVVRRLELDGALLRVHRVHARVQLAGLRGGSQPLGALENQVDADVDGNIGYKPAGLCHVA